MTKPNFDSLEQLKEQAYALQQLLLAHILATDARDSAGVDATLLIAAGQADSALANGRPLVAARIGALIEDL